MAYKSQDFQSVCANHIGKKTLPTSFLRGAKNYHPRLHRLLTGTGRSVHESDLELLANYLKSTKTGGKYSPNRLTKIYAVKSRMHREIRELNKQRKEKKYERPAARQKRIQQQLEDLKGLRGGVNPAMRDQINKVLKLKAIKKISDPVARRQAAKEMISQAEPTVARTLLKARIRTSTTKEQRHERSKEFVQDLITSRDQDDTIHTKPGMDDTTGRPSLAV